MSLFFKRAKILKKKTFEIEHSTISCHYFPKELKFWKKTIKFEIEHALGIKMIKVILFLWKDPL